MQCISNNLPYPSTILGKISNTCIHPGLSLPLITDSCTIEPCNIETLQKNQYPASCTGLQPISMGRGFECVVIPPIPTTSFQITYIVSPPQLQSAAPPSFSFQYNYQSAMSYCEPTGTPVPTTCTLRQGMIRTCIPVSVTLDSVSTILLGGSYSYLSEAISTAYVDQNSYTIHITYADDYRYFSPGSTLVIDLSHGCGTDVLGIRGATITSFFIGNVLNNVWLDAGGRDTLDGGGGSNTLDYSLSTAGVTIELASSAPQTGGYAEGDIISHFDNVVGSGFPDNLKGSSDANNLQGKNGDDVIEGGLGADSIDGGNGADTASYMSSSAAVAVNLLSSGVQTGGDAQGDILINIENLIGSANGDTLTGNDGVNNIQGGAGNDILDGGGVSGVGMDILTGGDGIDTFIFRKLHTSALITDFKPNNNEIIDLRAFTNIYTLSDLNPVNSEGNTYLTLPNNSGEIILTGIAPTALKDNNFAFVPTPEPTPEHWYTSIAFTATLSVIGGIGALAGLAYTMHNCKKDQAYCFHPQGLCTYLTTHFFSDCWNGVTQKASACWSGVSDCFSYMTSCSSCCGNNEAEAPLIGSANSQVDVN